MKLSEIKGEKSLDVMAEIIEPITNLAMDETVTKMFKREKFPEGKKPREVIIERVKNGMPVLIKEHKNDFIKIMSTIEEITEEEYCKDLTIPKLMTDVLNLMVDSAFTSIF